LLIIDCSGEGRVFVEEMDFLLVAHRDVRMLCEKIVQRRCSRFLRARYNEIESLDFSCLGSKHRAGHKSRTVNRFAQSGFAQIGNEFARNLSIFSVTLAPDRLSGIVMSVALTKFTRVAFVLVEILIVVAAIALLVAMTVPAFLRTRRSSQVTEIPNGLRRVDSAVGQYAA
jgi:hypothetical protein